jgi:hypothetical protein
MLIKSILMFVKLRSDVDKSENNDMVENAVIAGTSTEKALNDRVVLRCSDKAVINDVNKLNLNSFSTSELVDNK